MNPELKQKLELARRRTIRNFVIVEIILFALVLMLFGAFFYDPLSTPLAIRIALAAFGGGILLLMVLLGRITRGTHLLLEVIENRPYYIKKVDVLPVLLNESEDHADHVVRVNLYFLLEDGKRLVLSDKRSVLEPMVPFLKEHLSHAEFNVAPLL